MRLKVLRVQFDFTGDNENDVEKLHNQPEVYNMVYSRIWEVEDEDDLLEQIAQETGWLVEDIEFIRA